MNLKAVLFLLIFERGTLFMENSDDTREAGIEKREHRRHAIPAAVSCRLFKEDIKKNNSFQGFIQDISLGGVSLEITFAIDMPDGIHKVNVSGIVRWYRKDRRKDVNLLYLGVQFLNLGKSDKAILEKYLASGTGDKSFIWNLWDNLSIQP
jgi:hypothetical protein